MTDARIVGTDRPYRLERMVLTVCGECHRDDPAREIDYERDILQGVLVEEGGRLWLRRRCRRGHGEVVSLYEEDAALWRGLQEWRVPTRWVEPDSDDGGRPIPMGYLDGLGALQEQHTCILVVDLTDDCNIACPGCFAASRPGLDRFARVDDVLRTVDAALDREGGRLDLVMLSGGEPTIHPGLVEIIDGLSARNVGRLVVNTNGIVVARDDRLLAAIADRRRRVEVYLQYDGHDDPIYRRLRGGTLAETKRRALARLTGARVFTTLACTVARAVNEAAIGDLVDLALETEYVGGVVFQPLFGAAVDTPLDRVTTTGVLRRIEAQTSGRVTASDFVGLPCSHPDCTALTYLIRADDGRWRSLPDLVGLDRIRAHLGLAGNRLMPDDAMWQSLTGLLSGSMSVGRTELVEHLVRLSTACRLDVASFVRTLGRSVLGRRDGIEAAALRVKRLSVKGFMDPWTLNVERLRQCCVHVATVGRSPEVRIPFCARNAFPALRERTNGGFVPLAAVTGGTSGRA